MPNASAKPIVVATAGGIFLYSGIKGIKLSTTLRDLLTGRNPSKDAPGTSPQDASSDVPSSTIHVNPGNPGPAGQHLTVKQIYQYARGAGFSTTAAVTATAIAMAESGGRPNARCHNCVPGVTEDSRGLWQINVDAHPWANQQNIYDPATNAAAAYEVSSHGKSFTPWSTYTNGAYQQFIATVMKAIGQ